MLYIVTQIHGYMCIYVHKLQKNVHAHMNDYTQCIHTYARTHIHERKLCTRILHTHSHMKMHIKGISRGGLYMSWAMNVLLE